MSASSSFNHKFTYQVFLNFRGKDTRYGFSGNLYKALRDKGIHTFFDEYELPKGEEITPSLHKAIEDSRIAITVFSTNYAYSVFCLNELVKITECVKEKGRLVLPVFYNVNPSDVRYQTGTFGKAMAKHENGRFKNDKEKVQKWKKALEKVADLSGEHFKLENKQYQYVFIGKIVKLISDKINRVPLVVTENPVGLESRVQEVYSLLNDGDEVWSIGMYGIGGVGKTTLARAIYNEIADQFVGLCFLENVTENSSTKNGLVHLQMMLLYKILGEEIKLTSVSEGIPIIKERFQKKKILLVLDDVNSFDQLNALAGAPDWFGAGSKVIVTTKDRHLLKVIQRPYEVKDLEKEQQLELLTSSAFKRLKADSSYTQVLNEAVSYASGLPLALKVIGSNLLDRKVEEWKSALPQYKRILDKDILKILRVSFDSLAEEQQKIFLDIACCFKGHFVQDVEKILNIHHGFNTTYDIQLLIEKSLIKIDDWSKVTLHDLIQHMGRDIVRKESPEKLGNRTHLGLHEEIFQVLKDKMIGTSQTEIMNLDLPNKYYDEVQWNTEVFREMKNLKTLIIENVEFAEGPKYLPNSLRILQWQYYPSQSLPSDFHPDNLVILQLSDSFLNSLKWAEGPNKYLNLRVLNFAFSPLMTQIPDMSGLPNLEDLSFRYCENLTEIHPSVGKLSKLTSLDACGCEKLKNFPPLMLPCLENLDLSECPILESFPKILGKMENLTELYFWHNYFEEIPDSIQNLSQLRSFEMGTCGRFQLNGIFLLPELEILRISECKELLLPEQHHESSMRSSSAKRIDFYDCNIISDEFLQIVLPRFPNLQELDLSRNYFTILPACIKQCLFLKKLIVRRCSNLQKIRGIPPKIEEFFTSNCPSLSQKSRRMLMRKELHEEGGDKMFLFPGERIPKWYEHQSREPSISFWFRNEFPAISVCVLCGEKPFDFNNKFSLVLMVNGKKEFLKSEDIGCSLMSHHIFILDKIQPPFKDEVLSLSENEWYQAVISLDIVEINWPQMSIIDKVPVRIGVHIIEQKSSSMDDVDVRFTDPLAIVAGTKKQGLQEQQHPTSRKNMNWRGR